MSDNGEWRRSRHDRRVEWARLDPNEPGGIHLPKREGDVGWDLEAMCDMTISPMTAVDVPVNARVALPDGIWAEIRARSSIARQNLYVESGIIDPGYRGALFVLVRNMQLPSKRYEHYTGSYHEQNNVTIQKGERIGQLIFHLVAAVWTIEVAQVDTTTERAEAGFGSTGR